MACSILCGSIPMYKCVGAAEFSATRALLFVLLPQYGMGGYFISFAVTHLVNFLLSLRRLLMITEERIPFYIPALSAAAAMAAVLGASQLDSPVLRIGCYLALLGSLLYLFRVISREDFQWLRGVVKRSAV